MTKNYPDELGTWVKQQGSAPRDKNLIEFLAAADDVKQALAFGYTAKTIWANMHGVGRIGFGYHTFLNYVNRVIRQSAIDQVDQVDQVDQADQAGALSTPEPAKVSNGVDPKQDAKPGVTAAAKPAVATGFAFNATPKKEDFL